MNIMPSIVDLAGTAATWVFYFLIVLSVFQLTLIIERAIVFARSRAPATLRTQVRASLENRNLHALALELGKRSLEARVIGAGARYAERGADAAKEIMHSVLLDEKLVLERGLSILGTLGNNAPFLGLFGTVLGIIHSVAHLGAGSGQASNAVMSGISEALISTAAGLLIALPAVVAFNAYQRLIKARVVVSESIASELVAHLESSAAPTRKAA